MDAVKCEHCGLEINEYVQFCTGCGEPLASYRRPAGFWIRVGAYVIDSLLFIPIGILNIWNMYRLKSLPLLIGYSVIGMLYKPLMESFCGATLGKMACGLRVIDARGNKLSLLNAYVRFLPFLAPAAVSLATQILMYRSAGFQAAKSMQDMAVAQHNQNPFLLAVALLLVVVKVADCICAAFTFRKRALHDMMAESYCVYKEVGD